MIQNRSTASQCVLGALVCLPFCGTARLAPDPSFWSQWTAVLLALAWLLSSSDRRAATGIPYTALTLLFLAFLTALQMAFGMSAMPMGTLVAISVMCVASAVCIRASNLADTQPRSDLLEPMAIGIVIALVANAVACLMSYGGYSFLLAGIVHSPVEMRAVGLVGQSNHLAVLAVLAQAAVVFLRSRKRIGRSVAWCLLVLAACVCTVAGSRVGLLAWLVPCVFAMLKAPPSSESGRSAPTVSTNGIAMFVALAAAQIAWTLVSPHFGGLEATAIRTDSHQRIELIRDSLTLWLRHPISGVGQGNLAEWRVMTLEGPMSEPHATHAHDIVLQALAEWGTVGGLAVLSILIYLCARISKALRSKQDRPEQLFICSWITVVIVHSLVEHPLWFMRFLMPFAVMVGLLEQKRLSPLEWFGERKLVIQRAVLSIGLAICAASAFDYARIQTLTSDMISQIESSTDGKANISLKTASHISNLTLFPVFPEIMLARALPINAAQADEKLRIVSRAMYAIPNAESMARYVAFSVVAGKTEQASFLMNSMKKRNPPVYNSMVSTLGKFAEVSPSVRLFAGQFEPLPLDVNPS